VALNQPFDATKMEAVDTRDGEEGKVVEVVSNGYELNGVVIKHVRVVVGTKSN
jgi:molecular chaperone GrpE (heat shock protein)